MNLEQNKVYIKTSNYWAIHDFALFGNRSRIYGTKLKALYHLVQAKGEALDWGSSHKYEGLKYWIMVMENLLVLLELDSKATHFTPVNYIYYACKHLVVGLNRKLEK
tara:strand:+ start:1235 stop:1555 length:321 start_codon:yes stop_codon:yes gene_type:complete